MTDRLAGLGALRQALIDAKLSGTSKADSAEWGYSFRTNEQAADIALDVLERFLERDEQADPTERIYRVVCANGTERVYHNGRIATARWASDAHALKRVWDIADEYKPRSERTGPHRVQHSDDEGETWEPNI